MKLRRLRMSSQQRPYFVGLFILLILLFHQNCSQPGSINVTQNSSVADLGDGGIPTGGAGGGSGGGGNPLPQTFSSDTFANTELNTPVEFVVEKVKEEVLSGVRLTDSQFVAPNGSLELLNATELKFKYTPKTGFRGNDYSLITAVDDRGRAILFHVKIVVANPVQNLKPALAIRGMGCIQCHAKVDSNIVTDFGFDNSYYFSASSGSSWWKSGGVYGDHGKNFSTMDLKPTIKVLVPKAPAPTAVTSDNGSKSLAEYLRYQFAASTLVGTKAATVEEKAKIYIGSPTATDIEMAFSMKVEDRIVYFKNGDSSAALSGLSDRATYVKNDGVLICEGDVAIRGPLYFNNLKVNSSTGCRIYVIGSVFIFGGIEQIHISENRNLQITSTKSISMGLGLTKKDNSFCEPNSRFATDKANYNVSSLKNRYSTFWTVPSYFTRGSSQPVVYGNSVVDESLVIEKGEGLLMDAACREEGRNVSFDRLLLNAPAVHGRYEGNFMGTIIAEYAIMSLGEFKFQYDPVFDRVPILPMLKHEVYLDIQ